MVDVYELSTSPPKPGRTIEMELTFIKRRLLNPNLPEGKRAKLLWLAGWLSRKTLHWGQRRRAHPMVFKGNGGADSIWRKKAAKGEAPPLGAIVTYNGNAAEVRAVHTLGELQREVAAVYGARAKAVIVLEDAANPGRDLWDEMRKLDS